MVNFVFTNSERLRKVHKRHILTEMTNDDKNDKMSLLAEIP